MQYVKRLSVKVMACYGLAALGLATPLRMQASDSNDAAGTTGPVVEILATDATALAGVSTAAFTLVRTGDTSTPLDITLAIGGSASNGLDYVQVPATVTIPAGFQAVDLPIIPIANADRRGNHTVVLSLVTNSLYSFARASAKVTIVDDTYNLAPPTIAITQPTNGTVFHTPGTLDLQVEAGNGGAALKQVTYFANDDVIGRATAAPWSCTWTNPPKGKWALFARALDTAGKSALSQPVEITVTNAAPLAAILTPTNGTVLTGTQNVPIHVEFSDADDAIKSVLVYGDGKKLAELAASPGNVTWTNVGPGKHTVTVRVVDSAGTATFVRSNFTINENRTKITLTSPASGANFTAPADVKIEAAASQPVSAMEFWFDGHKAGTVTNTPYSYTVTGVKAGFHSLYAVGVETSGKRSTSGAIYISVSR